MARCGIGNNLQYPMQQCIGCKYWKYATKVDMFGFHESGRCTAGYCKKQAIRKYKK